MEELSYAYIHALAAKEGYRCVRPIPDRDSIDVQVQSKGKLASDSILESPMIQFQLKAVGKDDLKIKKGAFSFSKLKIKNYDELRVSTAVPRLLAVLIMPEDANQWLNQSVSELTIRKCMYWYSLLGLPGLVTDQETTTVHIPEAQCLTAGSLTKLLTAVSRDEELNNGL